MNFWRTYTIDDCSTTGVPWFAGGSVWGAPGGSHYGARSILTYGYAFQTADFGWSKDKDASLASRLGLTTAW